MISAQSVQLSLVLKVTLTKNKVYELTIGNSGLLNKKAESRVESSSFLYFRKLERLTFARSLCGLTGGLCGLISRGYLSDVDSGMSGVRTGEQGGETEGFFVIPGSNLKEFFQKHREDIGQVCHRAHSTQATG